MRQAADIAREHGVAAETRLAEGKPFRVLCTLSLELGADLVVVGHSGMHRSRYSDIGSTTERVAELAKTNVLVVRDRTEGKPPAHEDGKIPVPARTTARPATAGRALLWDDDAKKRLENVPKFARPMAVMAIERYAKEHKITTITPDVMSDAREKMGI